MTAITMTITDSDSGGGIQADLKTFFALRLYGASVITAITAQNTQMIAGIDNIFSYMAGMQINAVLDDLDVDAIKIGIPSSPDMIDVVTSSLKDVNISIVPDTVMVAQAREPLLDHEIVFLLVAKLVPLVRLLVINLPEAACFLKTEQAKNPMDMVIKSPLGQVICLWSVSVIPRFIIFINTE